MKSYKLTPELAALTSSANANDCLDIIVELKGSSAFEATDQGKSRSEKIEMQKEAFKQSLAPLEDRVGKIGGEITGRAWINRSVRLRLPAIRISELSEIETVAKLDVPRHLNADNSQEF